MAVMDSRLAAAQHLLLCAVDERQIEERLRGLLVPELGDALRLTIGRPGPADGCRGANISAPQRIFEDFVQAAGGQERQTQGTGLELPLSRRLATLLGGTIDVESRPGSGSTFRLRVPLEPPVTAPPMPEPPTEPLPPPPEHSETASLSQPHPAGARPRVPTSRPLCS